MQPELNPHVTNPSPIHVLLGEFNVFVLDVLYLVCCT